MKAERISGVVQAGHKGDAVEVPFDPGAKWGVTAQQIGPGRRAYRVVCRIGATRFDSCVVARSKKFWLLLSSEIEDKLSIKAGDTVSVALEPS
jgi:hypothetical protein